MAGKIITIKNHRNDCWKSAGTSWPMIAGVMIALVLCLYSLSVKAGGDVVVQAPVDMPVVLPPDFNPSPAIRPNEIISNGAVSAGAADVHCFDNGNRFIHQTSDRAIIEDRKSVV